MTLQVNAIKPSDSSTPSPRLQALIDSARASFESAYGHPAQWVAIGPGRVNLIGEHVDYNDGFVLPMAIERHVVMAGAMAKDSKRSRLASQDEPEVVTFDTSEPMQRGEPAWANYVRGVIAGFQQRGTTVPAFDAMISADLPIGGGLSSSAALEVATATLLEALTGTQLSPVEKALLCQRAEHEFALVPCGIMDQFASTMGRRDHLLLLDCRSQEVRYVPMLDESVAVLIVNTNVKHELTEGGYALRRKQCEEAAAALGVKSLRNATMQMLEAAKDRMEPVIFKRARHVIGEIRRTVETADALTDGDWPAVGRKMYESHASLRDDFQVSCEELDLLVELAQRIDAGEAGDASLRGSIIGCRMTGGGFGGCVVSLVRADQAENVATLMAQLYEQRTSIAASHFVTRPADGARLAR